MLNSDVQQNIFYRLIQYGYLFMVCNLYFSLLCVPVLIYLVIFREYSNLFYWLVLVVFCIPIGPAFTASLSVMGKLVRSEHISITRDFFRSLKRNFVQSSIVFLLQAVTFSVLLIDIVYFQQHTLFSFFAPMLYVVIVINVITGFYLYPFISYFCISTISVIKLSIWCVFMKIKITLPLLILVVVMFALILYFPLIILQLLIGPLCFGIMYMQNYLFEEINNQFNQGMS